MLRHRPLALLVPALVLVSALALVAGCGSKSTTEEPTAAGGTTASPTTPAPAADATPAVADGATLFKQKCAICHGPDGHGDGPTARALNPKPRNFHDVTYMNSRPDDSLLIVIRNGKGAMPKWGGVLKDEEITALVTHIRELSKKP